MANIVNIDELLPEDVEIVYRDKTYTIPGDVQADMVFRLLDAFRQLTQLVGATDEKGEPIQSSSAEVDRVAKNVNKQMLALFQLSDPELKELPFGTKSMPIVVREVLKQLGITQEGGEGNRASRRAQKKSATSTGTTRARKPASTKAP